MHIHYEWRQPEEPLGTPVITAVHMTIEFLENNATEWLARGTFTFRDHVEGIDGKNSWTAVGMASEDEILWTVRRSDPLPHEFVFQSKSQEPLFCLGSGTNAAIKTFIAGKLAYVVAYMREHPESANIAILDEPEHYQGIRYVYSGSCVCQKIASSHLKLPFNWHAHTNGGQYPANCFQCSCRRQWYRANPRKELWVIVGDPDAWSMLIQFNGVIVEAVTLDPEKNMPHLVLVRNLRRRGLIPLG